MIKRKRIREKGKVPISRYFQKFDSGDSVALVMELGDQSPGFPKRMQGKTGKILEKKGSSYVVEVKDFNMKKKYSVRPIHLKKIKTSKSE